MIHLVTVASVLTSQVRPAPVVNTKDASETDLWTSRLGVSHGELADAIEKVGPSIAAIRQHLGK